MIIQELHEAITQKNSEARNFMAINDSKVFSWYKKAENFDVTLMNDVKKTNNDVAFEKTAKI